MSNILVTGITALHCEEDYYLRQHLRVVPSELALVTILRELGHTVEQRPVKWGEDLDKYDRIITYLCGTDSFVCGYTDGAMWTLKREDTLVAFDDWQLDRTIQDGTYKTSAKWKDTFVKQMNGITNREEIDEIHHDWCNNRRIILPAFNHGDPELFFQKSKKSKGKKDWFATQNFDIHTYDPNPFLPGRVPENQWSFEDRKKEWVVAGLQKLNREYHKKWKPDLPVVELGGRGENGFRMTEPEAIEWFGERWLHAMPGYTHAGSGWWRSRPSQLAGHGVVTYCDPKEGAVYGPSWVIEDAKALEDLSETELKDLGERQANEFFERHPLGEDGKALAVEAMRVFLG